jgi:hypothetical protein
VPIGTAVVTYYNKGGEMTGVTIIWDLHDDPDGNVQRIAEHGITVEEVEEVLSDRDSEDTTSKSSGRPITRSVTRPVGVTLPLSGNMWTTTRLLIYPVTAYDAPERSRRR